jgi:hypothetical protein
MAVSNFFPEQNETNTPGTPGGGGVLGGGGNVAGGAAPAAPAAPTSSGTGFTNLQRYLDVNKDTGGLANQVAEQAGAGIGAFGEGLRSTAQGFADTLNTEANQFQSNIVGAGGAVPQDPQRINQLDTSDLGIQGNQGRTRLNKVQDLAGSNRFAQQQLLKQAGGPGFQSGFGKLDSLILAGTNQGGLDQALQGNKNRINQEIAGAGRIVQDARVGRNDAAQQFSDSVTARNDAIAQEQAQADAAQAELGRSTADKLRDLGPGFGEGDEGTAVQTTASRLAALGPGFGEGDQGTAQQTTASRLAGFGAGFGEGDEIFGGRRLF